jgi:cell wall-associated NlpC family hydrolase
VLQVPTGDTLIADHLAVYLAGGMVIHATDQEVEVVSMSNLKQPVSVVEYCGE